MHNMNQTVEFVHAAMSSVDASRPNEQEPLLRHSLASYATVTFSILVLYAVTSVVRQYARLRHVQGPPGAGFSKWWLVRTVYGGRQHLDFYDAFLKYGMCNVAQTIQQTSGVVVCNRSKERGVFADLSVF